MGIIILFVELGYKHLLHIPTVKMVTFILTIDVCYEDGSPFLAKCNSYRRLHELQPYGERLLFLPSDVIVKYIHKNSLFHHARFKQYKC